MSQFAVGEIERELLGPISKYFAMVETNGRRMLHLHYLVWWRGALHLATLHSQIQDNYEFRQKLLLFLEHNIKRIACPDPHPETLQHIYPVINNPMNKSEFLILLKEDSESIVIA